MMISGAVLAGGHDGSGGGPKGQPGDGHCNYIQENMFAGPFAVCEQPANAAGCEELGNTDDNADAAHGEGDCPVENLVGTCDRGDSQLLYYEGDPGGLEIGCGFQGGEWVAP
jgi:hypothetical protein